jgi:hypothetical protein
MSRWTHGAVLVGEPDQIPDDSLRLARNVRLDRVLGLPSVRPGWSRRSFADFAAAISYLSRLFIAAGGLNTVSYAQVLATLYRLRDDATGQWVSASAIATVGAPVVSDANMPDGHGHLHKYFVSGTTALKDDGTNLTTIGIAPPTAPPVSAALAPDITQLINSMDSAAQWTGFGLATGPVDDTANYITAPGSVAFSGAPSTFFGIAAFATVEINLDGLAGGDNLVKDDDYIHLWVRVDSPQNLLLMQIDIDVDAASTSVATSFLHNYYSVTIGSLAVISQGQNQWNQVQIRKNEFARYGSDLTRDWHHAQGFRVGFLTSSLGGVTINLDDFKLRGGVGIEGDIEYTVCYRNTNTGARGNPPKDPSGIVQYTVPLTTNRQRISLTISNVVQGGANHPGDTQIDHMMIWRKGGIFDTAVLVDEIPDTAPSPYVDAISDATLVLRTPQLELDNDLPPTGTTRFLFGPDATGHLFMIIDGYRLHFCKPYEDGENRADNWPKDAFALIGDGSYKAVTGIAQATQTFVWTTALKYNVVGVGQETFLPVGLDGTRGAVSQWACTSGDNRIFTVSQDGIYEHQGVQEAKLTGGIDPFFQGLTVDGQLGWNTDPAATVLARLEFLHEPTGSMLVLLYCDSSSHVLNKHLVLKPNSQDGRLTEAFFDSSALTTLQSLFLDNLSRELLAGGADGVVYRIEDPLFYTDVTTPIAALARTKSYDLGQPQRGKYVTHITAEGQTTGQNVLVAAVYDRGALTETLGNLSTLSEVGFDLFPTREPQVTRHDIALELSGSLTSRTVVTRLGCLYEAQPEPQVFLDTGLVSFDFVQQLKRFEIDIDLLVQSALTIYVGAAPVYTARMPPTTGRQNVPYPLPAGLQGRIWRVTLLAATPFLCYRLSGFFKQLGVDQSYTEKVLVQGV